ncbi:VOC family protein [Thermodesulfovibrio sp.]|uniref:VOC family protein n=1 Tax=Thermodesulfovibrio sp. TaxID=2067987 RepID=UPI0030B682E5
MIKNIRHIGIVVSNLELSLHFYSDLLGFKVVKKMEESGEYIDNISSLKNVKITTVKMAAPDGNLVELLYYHSHQRATILHREIWQTGISHIAFSVDDIEQEYNRLSAAGVTFNSPPQLSTDGYAKVTFCRDPDGNFIELVEVLDK